MTPPHARVRRSTSSRLRLAAFAFFGQQAGDECGQPMRLVLTRPGGQFDGQAHVNVGGQLWARRARSFGATGAAARRFVVTHANRIRHFQSACRNRQGRQFASSIPKWYSEVNGAPFINGVYHMMRGCAHGYRWS